MTALPSPLNLVFSDQLIFPELHPLAVPKEVTIIPGVPASSMKEAYLQHEHNQRSNTKGFRRITRRRHREDVAEEEDHTAPSGDSLPAKLIRTLCGDAPGKDAFIEDEFSDQPLLELLGPLTDVLSDAPMSADHWQELHNLLSHFRQRMASGERQIMCLEYDLGSALREGLLDCVNALIAKPSNFKANAIPTFAPTGGWYQSSSSNKGAPDYMVAAKPVQGVCQIKGLLELKRFTSCTIDILTKQVGIAPLRAGGYGKAYVPFGGKEVADALTQMVLEFHRNGVQTIVHGTCEDLVVARIVNRRRIQVSRGVPRNGRQMDIKGHSRLVSPFTILVGAALAAPAADETVFLSKRQLSSIVGH